MGKKIKLAFIKFGGLSAGGTERFIQCIAANLPKNKYQVDYYYCDAAPYVGSDWQHPDTDPAREKYMEDANVNLIKFHVDAKDVTKPHHPWLGTDLWDVFNPADYDIVQSARAGHPEYPFTEINDTPIIDIITLPGMAEQKANVFKTVHISQFQANTWIQAGGDASRVEIVPIIGEMAPRSKSNFRKELGIPKEDFVFGFHQRADDGIFSPVALEAYKRVMTDETHFVVMGGSPKYSEYAQHHNLANFHQLPHTGDNKIRDKFLATLNAFTHSRKDGETFGLAISEALYYKLPVVSHVAPAMGHAETIGDAGVVTTSLGDYSGEMLRMMRDKEYCKLLSDNAEKRYVKHFSVEANMKKMMDIYEACMQEKAKDDLPDEDFWDDMYND